MMVPISIHAYRSLPVYYTYIYKYIYTDLLMYMRLLEDRFTWVARKVVFVFGLDSNTNHRTACLLGFLGR